MNQKGQRLIEQFNQPGGLLVISSYPEKGVRYSGKVCAVGGFAKNTIDCIKEVEGKTNKVVILTFAIGKEDFYQENGVLVWRVFQRNNPLSFLKLIKAAAYFGRIKNILVEFEFASFGDTLTTIFLPLVLCWLRIRGKKVNLVLHQVVENLQKIKGHVGFEGAGIKTWLFNLGLRAFLFSTVFMSSKVVVLEEELKKRLVILTGQSNKIFVIPHGVDTTLKAPSKAVARANLGLPKNVLIVLYFGYLTWYKGIDFLIRVFAKNKIDVAGRPVWLLVAGGESTTQKHKVHYQRFVKNVYSLAQTKSRISITGFVDEREIPLYFSVADLVVLPYRAFMSSSGPLSLACSFGKPFLMSTRLVAYFKSSDFAIAARKTGLTKKELVFPLKGNEMIKKVRYVFEDGKLAKLARFSRELAKARDFSILAQRYIDILEPTPESRKAFTNTLSFLREG